MKVLQKLKLERCDPAIPLGDTYPVEMKSVPQRGISAPMFMATNVSDHTFVTSKSLA